MELQSDISKRYLAEALILLMREKDYAKITNKDITDRAGLSHITIYRNFKTKDEIIKYYISNLTDNFIKESKIAYDPDNFKEYLIKLFTHLEKNKDIAILLYNADMIHYLKDEFDQIFLKKAANKIQRYHYSFISGGLYNIYYFWIKDGCRESPEELADLFNEFYISKEI